MVTELITFIECTSLSISYDIMGIATVSYTLISNDPAMKAYPPGQDYIDAGGRRFEGYISAISMKQIPETNWYENQVTLIATTTT